MAMMGRLQWSWTQVSCASLACAVLSLSGCGGGVEGRPKLAPVTGTVLYNGEPIAGATVTFWAEKAPRGAAGVTNDKGEFKLSMFDVNDGAALGDNKVTVVKPLPSNTSAAPATTPTGAPDPLEMAKMAQDMTSKKAEKPPKPLVPAKYAKAETTPLKETVVEQADKNKFVLQLAD